jgi:Phosphotransferase enzyme family
MTQHVMDAGPGGPQVRPALGQASRQPHAAVDALVDLGLLRSDQAVTAKVTNLSRAHPVWSVRTASGHRFVVKLPNAERGFDLGIEFLVYRMAVWNDAVRRVLPIAHVVNEERHLLVLEDLSHDGSPVSLAVRAGWPPALGIPSQDSIAPSDLTRIASTLGATLGRLHRGTAGLPLPPARRPAILTGLTGQDPQDPTMRASIQSLRQHPDLQRAAELMSAPVAGCLVNHDLKWDNVVVAEDGRVVLLDWELAGLGDPAWDLGCLVSEHLVRDGEGALTTSAEALVRSYAETAELRPEIHAIFARRTATAAALRVAQLSLEVAGRPAEAVLHTHALTLVGRLPSLTDEVQAWLR